MLYIPGAASLAATNKGKVQNIKASALQKKWQNALNGNTQFCDRDTEVWSAK